MRYGKVEAFQLQELIAGVDDGHYDIFVQVRELGHRRHHQTVIERGLYEIKCLMPKKLYKDELFNPGDSVHWTDTHLHWVPDEKDAKLSMMPIQILGMEEICESA